jgi:predicted aspartyl protease
VFGQFRIVHVKYSRYLFLSVISVVFLWSVSIDRANLNVLVVISKLLGQSIIGMRQLPRMNILVLNKDWLRHQNQ